MLCGSVESFEREDVRGHAEGGGERESVGKGVGGEGECR